MSRGHGRGPTRLMSPRSTFSSCGTSSRYQGFRMRRAAHVRFAASCSYSRAWLSAAISRDAWLSVEEAAAIAPRDEHVDRQCDHDDRQDGGKENEEQRRDDR